MTTSKLQILLDAKDRASAKIKGLSGNVGNLDKQADNLASGKLFTGLAAGAGVAGMVALGGAAIGVAADLARASAASLQVEGQFNQLSASAGENASDILNAMKFASKGTVDNTALMQAANRGMVLGVADSMSEFGSLMDIAAARAKTVGLTTEEAFEKLVTGIGRQSPLILDDLGITVDLIDAKELYAKSLGRTAKSLSEAETKQALFNAIQRDSAALVEQNANAALTAEEAYQKLDAQVANLKDSIGRLLVPIASPLIGGMAQSIGDLADVMDGAMSPATLRATHVIKAAEKALADWQRSVEISTGKARENAEAQVVLAQAALDVANEALDASTASNEAAGSFGDWALVTGEMTGAANTLASTLPDLAGEIINVGLEARLAKGELDSFLGERDRIAGAAEGIAAGGIRAGVLSVKEAKIVRDEAQSTLTALDRQLVNVDGLVRGSSDYNLAMEAGKIEAAGSTDALKKAAQEAERLGRGVKKVTEEQKKFNDLVSKVESVLSGSLSLDGINLDDILPREDAINENARRLADIAVNGFADQDWLGELESAVPDIFAILAGSGDPKGEATKMLREFESGLRPELIDKEAAKERIKAMLLGEQNLSELAQEIATELAESMPDISKSAIGAAVNQGLGLLGGSEGLGGEFGEGAVGAMDEKDFGGQMVSKLKEQIGSKANIQLLRDSGVNAGATWGSGFLETVGQNVPVALIDILVGLVLPGVAANIQLQSSLTEPAT